MPFAITTSLRFCASHQLRLYDGSLEELHEHDWQVKLTVSAAGLDAIGVVMDFHELTRRLEEIVAPLRGSLNDLPGFSAANPSAENVAFYIAQRLALPESVALRSVEVWETAENSAIYCAQPVVLH